MCSLWQNVLPTPAAQAIEQAHYVSLMLKSHGTPFPSYSNHPGVPVSLQSYTVTL